jgi:hypothetical protein
MLETPETFSSRLSFTGLTMREIFLNGMWIVFMLNRLSNLLILYDMVCWNGKMATPVDFPFPVVVFFLWYIGLLKSALLLPFRLKTSLKYRIFVLRPVLHIVLARFIRTVRIAYFYEGLWCDFSCRHRSVGLWVWCLYTLCPSGPFGFLVTSKSRNISDPFLPLP